MFHYCVASTQEIQNGFAMSWNSKDEWFEELDCFLVDNWDHEILGHTDRGLVAFSILLFERNSIFVALFQRADMSTIFTSRFAKEITEKHNMRSYAADCAEIKRLVRNSSVNDGRIALEIKKDDCPDILLLLIVQLNGAKEVTEFTLWRSEIDDEEDEDEEYSLAQTYMENLQSNEKYAIVNQQQGNENQSCIARRLYQKVILATCGDGNYLEKTFKKFDFKIFLPRFNTLKTQTITRVLDKFGENFPVDGKVFLTGSMNAALTNKLIDAVLSNPDTLTVVIVDECHWGPTIRASSANAFINDPRLLTSPNFVVVMVSATPYNCLTANKRVSDDNVIVWSKVLEAEPNPINYPYVGLEHYLSTIQFMPESNGELSFSFQADGMPTKAWIRLSPGKSFGSYAALAREINDQFAKMLPTGFKVKFVYWEQRSRFAFAVQCKSGVQRFVKFVKWNRENNVDPNTFIVCSEGNGILEELGFKLADHPILVDDSGSIVKGKDSSTYRYVDDGDVEASAITVVARNLVDSQKIRADFGFERLRDVVLACLPINRKRSKNSGKRSKNNAITENNDDDDEGDCPATEVTPATAPAVLQINNFFHVGDIFQAAEIASQLDLSRLQHMPEIEPRDSFALVLDYVMSLAFFASCGEAITSKERLNMNNVAKFLTVLVRSCYVAIPGSNHSEELLNLSKPLVIALEFVIDGAKKEPNCPSDPRQAILHMLQSKVDDFFTVLSEVTQTDKIVWKLLTERDPVPMVLMRLRENDENYAFQNTLRNCLRVCEFPCMTSGAKFTQFCVIGDTARTDIYQAMNSDEFGKDYLGLVTTAGDCTKLTYSDLFRLACLVIVCERARMGDTLPHSLCCIDLRMRTGVTISCLEQELGRMCRYVKWTNYDVPTKFDPCVLPRLVAYRVVEGKESFCGVVDTMRKFRKCQQSVVNIKYGLLDYSLPYALIESTMLSKISAAYEHDNPRFIEKVAIPLDTYVIGRAGIANVGTANVKATHFDCRNTAIHDRRLLLSAQCQVGKTGAYLELLHTMWHLDWSGNAQAMNRWLEWMVPPGLELLQTRTLAYDQPVDGKYHRKLANQRLDLLCKSAVESLNGIELRFNFIEYVLAFESVGCGSARGKEILDKLPSYDVMMLTQSEDKTTFVISNVAAIKSYINWDGRLKNYVDHCERQLVGHTDLLHRCIVRCDMIRHVGHNSWLSPMATDSSSSCSASSPYQEMDVVVVVDQLVEDVIVNDNDDEDGGDDGCELVCDYEDECAEEGDENSNCAAARLDAGIGVDTSARYLQSELKLPTDGTIRMIHWHSTFDPVKVWIPSTALGDDMFAVSLHDLVKEPKAITKWIFTPTYCGNALPTSKHLDRSAAFSLTSATGTKLLSRFDDYMEVLVVRSEEFDKYMEACWATHVIVALPDQMGDDQCSEGMIGYCRRFIQLFASSQGLDSVWMTDDNIIRCYRYYDNGSKCKKVSFAEVMVHIEALVRGKPLEEHTSLCAELKDFDIALKKCNMNVPKRMLDVSNYGIIGMRRPRKWAGVLKNPIASSFSVYSFFWLNVADTVNRDVLYPSRCVGEDIEFAHMLVENRWIPCKMNAFSHFKLPRAQTGLLAAITRKYSIQRVQRYSPDLGRVKFLPMCEAFLELAGSVDVIVDERPKPSVDIIVVDDDHIVANPFQCLEFTYAGLMLPLFAKSKSEVITSSQCVIDDIVTMKFDLFLHRQLLVNGFNVFRLDQQQPPPQPQLKYEDTNGLMPHDQEPIDLWVLAEDLLFAMSSSKLLTSLVEARKLFTCLVTWVDRKMHPTYVILGPDARLDLYLQSPDGVNRVGDIMMSHVNDGALLVDGVKLLKWTKSCPFKFESKLFILAMLDASQPTSVTQYFRSVAWKSVVNWQKYGAAAWFSDVTTGVKLFRHHALTNGLAVACFKVIIKLLNKSPEKRIALGKAGVCEAIVHVMKLNEEASASEHGLKAILAACNDNPDNSRRFIVQTTAILIAKILLRFPALNSQCNDVLEATGLNVANLGLGDGMLEAEYTKWRIQRDILTILKSVESETNLQFDLLDLLEWCSVDLSRNNDLAIEDRCNVMNWLHSPRLCELMKAHMENPIILVIAMKIKDKIMSDNCIDSEKHLVHWQYAVVDVLNRSLKVDDQANIIARKLAVQMDNYNAADGKFDFETALLCRHGALCDSFAVRALPLLAQKAKKDTCTNFEEICNVICHILDKRGPSNVDIAREGMRVIEEIVRFSATRLNSMPVKLISKIELVYPELCWECWVVMFLNSVVDNGELSDDSDVCTSISMHLCVIEEGHAREEVEQKDGQVRAKELNDRQSHCQQEVDKSMCIEFETRELLAWFSRNTSRLESSVKKMKASGLPTFQSLIQGVESIFAINPQLRGFQQLEVLKYVRFQFTQLMKNFRKAQELNDRQAQERELQK